MELENKEKAILKVGNKEYTLIWNKEENNWVGKMGSITFEIYEN